MKKIKILFTINYLTNGGPTRVLQNIIYGIDRNKYEINILTLLDKNNCDIISELLNLRVKLYELKLKKGKLGIILNKKRISRLIYDINPDIIHVHGIEMAYIVSRKNIKCIKLTTIHNSMYEDYKYSYGKYKGKFIEWLHIFWLKKFDENVCCSKTSYNYLSKKINNASYIRNGIIVKHNKVDNRNKIRKKLGFGEKDIVFVYGGVINSRKRVLELVKMFKRYGKNNEYLLIVGDGPLLVECKQVANKNTIFVGFKSNIVDYFDASDIYISNSSSEGFSISLIEAFSSGLLCLVSDIPSHKECFEIDNKIYIGEIFNKSNFCTKKEIITKRMKNIDKESIKQFQKKYLSSKSMANLYCKKYFELVRKWER